MCNQIKTENIDSILIDLSTSQQKFNIETFKVLLENSCYYPASGTDTSPIKYLEEIQSFIYCDYIYDEDKWMNEIIKEMRGYELLFQEKLNITKFFDEHFLIKQSRKKAVEANGIKNRIYEQEILIDELHRSENNESLIQEKDNDINYLENRLHALNDIYTNNNLLESLLKKTTSYSQITIWKKNDRYLSIIYISAEAVHCYEQVFLNHKATPTVIAIIQPGHTMGGNWTNFFDSRSEFLETVRKGSLPKFMLIGSYEGFNNRYQVSYDHCNYEEVPESVKIIRDITSNDGHYVFCIKNKEHSRLDLKNKTTINEINFLLETVIFENWCLSINCQYCDNWNIRSVLAKLKQEDVVQAIKLFTEEFLKTHGDLFRFLVHEIRKSKNGNELIQRLDATPSYIQIQKNIQEDERYAKDARRKQEEEKERINFLKLSATPEAIAERKAIRKQLREIKTSSQRNRKELTKFFVADFITIINCRPDSELLHLVTGSENKITMKAAGGIVYERLLSFLKSSKISSDDKVLLKKLATEHSWHWKKLYKKLWLDY